MTRTILEQKLNLRAQFEHFQVTVAALQETRANTPLFLETPNFFRFVSAATRGQGGTEIWFNKVFRFPRGVSWSKDDFTITHADPELLCITVKTPYGLWGFLSGHAPHMGRPASERKAWWQRFEQHVKRLRCRKHVFWLGDFNAQIAEHDELTVGDLADDDHNDNGACFCGVLTRNQMWLPSTYRDYHWGPIQTWFSAKCPAGKRLDYVAVSTDISLLKVASWVERSLDAGQIHLDHMAAVLRVVFVLPTTREKHSKKLAIDRSAVCDPRNREATR